MNKFDVTKSKCWNCKFGLCVFETEQEKLIHRGIGDVSDNFDIMSDFSELENENENENGERLLEHTIEHQSVKAICFWKHFLTGNQFAPPIAVAYIEQCNRFQENT